MSLGAVALCHPQCFRRRWASLVAADATPQEHTARRGRLVSGSKARCATHCRSYCRCLQPRNRRPPPVESAPAMQRSRRPAAALPRYPCPKAPPRRYYAHDSANLAKASGKLHLHVRRCAAAAAQRRRVPRASRRRLRPSLPHRLRFRHPYATLRSATARERACLKMVLATHPCAGIPRRPGSAAASCFTNSDIRLFVSKVPLVEFEFGFLYYCTFGLFRLVGTTPNPILTFVSLICA